VRLFDSHAHLTDERFGTEIGDVLARAVDEGVAGVVTIASDVDDAETALELARRYERPRIRCTAGIHPHVADLCTAASLDRIRELSSSDRIVALGEMGLDFYYENAPRQRQIEAFEAQIELAVELELPVVVHSREADVETARIVRAAAGRVIGVLHCFSAGDEVLQAGLAADWYVSFSGLITFKSFQAGEQVRRVPEDRLMVETDSPYLAPVPLRGRRNEPANVRYVLERLAEIRAVDPRRLAELTYQNARRFYGLDHWD
jgi:TatD DNase family protein